MSHEPIHHIRSGEFPAARVRFAEMQNVSPDAGVPLKLHCLISHCTSLSDTNFIDPATPISDLGQVNHGTTRRELAREERSSERPRKSVSFSEWDSIVVETVTDSDGSPDPYLQEHQWQATNNLTTRESNSGREENIPPRGLYHFPPTRSAGKSSTEYHPSQR
jgi:hypothetical protein